MVRELEFGALSLTGLRGVEILCGDQGLERKIAGCPSLARSRANVVECFIDGEMSFFTGAKSLQMLIRARKS